MTTKVKNQILDIICNELIRCRELLDRANNLYDTCEHADVQKLSNIRTHYQKLVHELETTLNIFLTIFDNESDNESDDESLFTIIKID